MSIPFTSKSQRLRFTDGQQRLLDVVATAILIPLLSNVPSWWLGSSSESFFPESFILIPITILVVTILLAASLYCGVRRFLLFLCIPPLAVVVRHVWFATQIPVRHTAVHDTPVGWHVLTRSRYLFEHSTQIIIAIFCIATLLYVFISSRRQANVA